MRGRCFAVHGTTVVHGGPGSTARGIALRLECPQPGILKERTMARVVRFHELGGPDVLKVEETVVPPPGQGEVQIAVKALGLNRAESMFRRGEYLETPKFPARNGYEASGTVAAVGPGVT